MARILLHDGRVFDGVSSKPAVGDLVIEGDRIVELGSGLDGDVAIDCSGKLLTPGLFDCHVHFMVDGDLSGNTHAKAPFSLPFYQAAERMARTLSIGITSVREAGGADAGVKAARDLGLIEGPRMQLSLTMLSQTGGHGDSWEICGAHTPGLLDAHPGRPANVIDGPIEARKKVRELIRAGAGVIKVATSGGVISPRSNPHHAQLRPDELTALVTEAAAAALYVMAHAQATQGIKNAVAAGVRSIEHGVYLDDEAIEMMIAAGTYLVPTLVAPLGVLEAIERGVDLPTEVVDKAGNVVLAHRESVSRAIEAGVRIAMGTDSGVTPHGQNLRELCEMEKLGMTSSDVLRASTKVAADLLGVSNELGSLEVGKVADIAIWEGESVDVQDLKSRVSMVIQGGAVVRRPA